VAATLCLLLAFAAQASSQGPTADRLEAGTLLVAADKLQDPNFRQSVVLLLDHGEDGTLGVILNRPSSLLLATAFPEIGELQDGERPVFFGGPVAPTGMLMVLRSKEKAEDDRPAFDDLYWSGSPERLERLAAEGETAQFRVFAGHAGWTAGQLENEVERDDWHILPATMEAVFDSEPLDLWRRLKRQIPERWAAFGPDSFRVPDRSKEGSGSPRARPFASEVEATR